MQESTAKYWDVQRHRICIFLRQLPGGKHSYRLRLLPQYSGLYTLNPAKVEMMYRPHLYGRTALKQVAVQERQEVLGRQESSK